MARRHRSRPFFTWRGFAVGGAILVVAAAGGWLLSRVFQGVGS